MLIRVDYRARGIAWKIVVRVLLADLILVIPLLLSYAFFIGHIPKSELSIEGIII
jgi:hypothetical protein